MINTERLHEIFMDCFLKPEEIVDGVPVIEFVKVEGILHDFGFHPERLASYTEEVKAMLLQLPNGFMKSMGGGQSFLNACMTKEGEQWADLHQTMEQLMCLGLGLKLVSYCMPREFWKQLPGCVPYFTVIDS